MIVAKILNENDNSSAVEKVIQYCASAQILELLKQNLEEMSYYKFIKDIYSSAEDKNDYSSAEEYIEQKLGKEKLLNYIKEYNIDIYNNIIDELISYIY